MPMKGLGGSAAQQSLHAEPSFIPTLEAGKVSQRRRPTKHPLAKLSPGPSLLPTSEPLHLSQCQIVYADTEISLGEENAGLRGLLLSLRGVIDELVNSMTVESLQRCKLGVREGPQSLRAPVHWTHNY